MKTYVWVTFGARSVFDLQDRARPLLLPGGAVFWSETGKKSWKVETLQRWLCWTGSVGKVFSSVSRGQRISSRCGAVKPVLCPKRLVTAERSPAIRCFLSVQQRCSLERSHPAPPPAPVPAFRSSSLTAGRWLGRLAEPWLAGPGGQTPWRSRGGGSLVQPLSRWRRWGKASPACRFRTPRADAASFPILASSPTARQARQAQGGPAIPERGAGPRSWWSGRARGAEPAPSPSPIGGARPRGRERGGKMGSSSPAPPLSPPGTNEEPPLPLRPVPRPSRRDPRRQSHWKKPRPPTGYLQTPSPRAAANRYRPLRLRDGGQRACALKGS